MSKISRIMELLDEEYGRQEWTYPECVLDELILTILSQNTTAKTCRQAFARLRERFPAWEDVRLARCSDVAEAIKVGGLANQKAPRIKQILEEVYAQQGSLDLEWLADVPDTEAVDYLLKFHGVGRKTAACTLMFALGRPVFPVDTHIHRIAIRVGLIGDVTADQAHDILQVTIAPEDVYSFHINLVTHGRQVCHAHSPECERCVINEECDYFVKRYKTE